MTDGMVVKKRQLPSEGGGGGGATLTAADTAPAAIRRVPPDKIRTVEEYLRSIKRHKAAKESRSWDWASRVLETDNNLKLGQKIFVRYEVQHIIDDSSSTNGEDDQDQTLDNQDEEDAIHRPQQQQHAAATAAAGTNAAAAAGISAATVATAATDSQQLATASEHQQPRHQSVPANHRGRSSHEDHGVTILDTRVFWWPAIIATRGDSRCATLAEEWKKLRPLVSLSHDALPEIDTIAKERPDIPVWELKYEAHDSFESENLPVAFLEGKKLLHLDVKHLNVGPYRTEEEVGGEEDEGIGGGADDSGPEATYDLETLSSILDGSSSCSIKGIVERRGGGDSSSSAGSSASEDEEYELYSSSPEVVSQRLLAGAKLQEVWRKFLRTMEKNRHRLVTAEMVRRFFNDELCASSSLGEQVDAEERSSGDEKESALAKSCLTESPFPRVPSESKVDSSSGEEQWDEVIEEEEEDNENESD